ncbi:MAG: hypothetical protein EOM31_00215 [Bacteroidia bacterium]|nr:hypothetical protein [Bacteroidia bacterium]
MNSNNSIYTAAKIAQIIGYHDLYPERMIPNIRKCMLTMDRVSLMHMISNMAEKLVNEPFYNPDYDGDEKEIDSLRFFFSALNSNYVIETINRYNKVVRRNKKIDGYIGATEDSLLYLLREVMSVKYRPIKFNRRKFEKDFFKALNAANQITSEKGRGKVPFDEITDPELYYAATVLRQFGSNLYHDEQLILISQTVRCLILFEFATIHSEFKPIVDVFCIEHGIKDEWWLYPKALWSVYCLCQGKVGEVNFDNVHITEQLKLKQVIDRSSWSLEKIISKKNNRDFTAFRTCPLIKMDEKNYFVYNHVLLIEHIYNSLYFEFKTIAERDFGFKGQTFNQLFTTEFSENCLFGSTMNYICKSTYEVAMTDAECQAYDIRKDAAQASPPDYYARKGNIVFLFENKDIKIRDNVREMGTLQNYIDVIYHNLVRNERRKPKGVGQLLGNVRKIRSGEFQRRWDPDCPKDAVVYPILVVADVKHTMSGMKNLLQYWQRKEYSSFDLSEKGIMPIILTDVSTLCLYKKNFAEVGFKHYFDDYYRKSSILPFLKNRHFHDLMNGLSALPDYMKTQERKGFDNFTKHWEDYIRRGN